MVHLYHYFAVDPNSQFFGEPRVGTLPSRLKLKNGKCPTHCCAGNSIAFFDSALNECDTLAVRGRTTSASALTIRTKFAAIAHAGLRV
jgi:hypothetical protein